MDVLDGTTAHNYATNTTYSSLYNNTISSVVIPRKKPALNTC